MPLNNKFPLQKIITIDIFSKVMSLLSISGDIKVAVAVSGGSDSLCLAILLKEWAKLSGIQLTALIVNHGLRENIDLEIKQTIEWLNIYNIETKVLAINKIIFNSKIQENARLERYKILNRYCKKNDICYLAVAHNFNDLIETVHMREQRKNNLIGQAGISFIKNNKDILIFRPLLFFTKNAIQNTLKKLQQSWIEDPSNQNIKFERVVTRKQIGDLTKEQIIGYFNKFNTLRNNRIFLEKVSLQFIIENVIINDFGVIEINLAKLLSLKEDFMIHILRILINFCSNKIYMTKIDKIKRFIEYLQLSLKTNKFRKFTIGNSIANMQNCKSLFLIKEPRSIKAYNNINTNSYIIWDDRFLIKNLHKFPSNYFFANLTSKEYNILNKNKTFKDVKKILNLNKEIISSLPWLFDVNKTPVVNWIYYLLDKNYMKFFPKKSLLPDLFWNFSIDKLYQLD